MRRITVALSVTALIGCGTAQKMPEITADPPRNEEPTDQGGIGGRVAKGAVGGAAFGALMCLGIAPAGLPVGGVGAIGSVLASLVCLPFGLVAGAVTGGTVAAVKSPSAQSATPPVPGGGPPTPRSDPGRGYLTRGAFILAASGPLDSADALPSGSLYVAMNTIVSSAGDVKRASLIVDFDGPTKEGEKSMIAHAVFACDKGAASIQRSFTYAEGFGHGAVVNSAEHAPAIVVERPGPVLSSAVRTVCDAGPWWNTPAQLYGK